MISNDHIVGFLFGVLYLGIIVILTAWREHTEDTSTDKGYTEHWRLEDR